MSEPFSYERWLELVWSRTRRPQVWGWIVVALPITLVLGFVLPDAWDWLPWAVLVAFVVGVVAAVALSAQPPRVRTDADDSSPT